ncbi:N-acyl homoserine lactonase family protein [Corallococcus carmarthensis]|uniref:N-acyl homoserine lactonase family protein n=1 Tax=Corallococcus carmarthensis TaxID=2316728 RepID=A0A3A8KZ00_9BACT|nr:N-acyl homoserine lactonase family protein [Corallococcus carmarthensis]RKH07224.1 N-acyl homoserine lactonase family protein [Corallococcus carmarthensis]
MPRIPLPRLAGLVVGLLTSACVRSTAPQAPPLPPVRLYALDCGHIDVKDMGFFADGSPPGGKPGELIVPCFVIQHPQGTLVWDTGLSDALTGGAEDPVGNRLRLETSLAAQLHQLGLTPADVRYVGFSHLHADHAGNANVFPASTWLLQRRELEWATRTPAPPGVDPSRFSAWRDVKLQLLDGDLDVFGDGTVRVISTPGHTPGHQSLVLRLRQAGTYVLSGDLCHTRENWERHGVPGFNDSRENTLASMSRVEALVKDAHGHFVVEHAPEDFRALPAFPAALE